MHPMVARCVALLALSRGALCRGDPESSAAKEALAQMLCLGVADELPRLMKLLMDDSVAHDWHSGRAIPRGAGAFGLGGGGVWERSGRSILHAPRRGAHSKVPPARA